MGFSLIQVGQTPGELIRLLATNSELASQVRSFFAPRCDCDAVEWVISQIQANDATIVTAIRALIAGEIVLQPPQPGMNILSANGDTFVLMRTWCEGQMRKGEILNQSGTLSTITIEVTDSTCA